MPTNLGDLIAQGYVHRYECSFTGVASGASVHIGVLTGSDEVVALGRGYGGSSSLIIVELFEAAYSGGSPARHLNRRLSSQRPMPVTVMQGVSVGALGGAITTASIRATTSAGNASINIAANDNMIFLKKNTSYVVRVTHGGSGSADIGAAFDLRAVVDGESLEKFKPTGDL